MFSLSTVCYKLFSCILPDLMLQTLYTTCYNNGYLCCCRALFVRCCLGAQEGLLVQSTEQPQPNEQLPRHPKCWAPRPLARDLEAQTLFALAVLASVV
jgi:hypothetical protein